MGVCLSKKERERSQAKVAPSKNQKVLNVHEKKESKETIDMNARVKEVNEQLINDKENKFELSMNTQSLNNNVQQNTSQDNNNGGNVNLENETVSKKDIEIKITEQNKKEDSINIKEEDNKSNEQFIKEKNIEVEVKEIEESKTNNNLIKETEKSQIASQHSNLNIDKTIEHNIEEQKQTQLLNKKVTQTSFDALLNTTTIPTPNNDNISSHQKQSIFTLSDTSPESLYYLNEFHLNKKDNFSSSSDFYSILSTVSFQNKILLSSKLVTLKERQWLKESIYISNLIKRNRSNNDSSLITKYLHTILSLYNDFNWLVWAVSFIYESILFSNNVNWFSNIGDTALPPVDSLDWVSGFEWKGVYIKVQPLDKSKRIKNEIKSLKNAFLDYIQILDCVKVGNEKLLSNDIVFPLISYCEVGGVVMTMSACVNKYTYDDTSEENLINESKCDLTMAEIVNKNTYSVFEADLSYIDMQNSNKLVNYDINIDDYSKEDLKHSSILSKITKKNLIKIINDDNTNDVKYLLIDIVDLVPELQIKHNEVYLASISNEKENNFTAIEDSNDSNKIKEILYRKYNIVYDSEDDLHFYENRFYNFKYKLLYQDAYNNKSISNANVIFDYFINLPYHQNEKISALLSRCDSNADAFYQKAPTNSNIVIAFDVIHKTKMKYSLIPEELTNSIDKKSFVSHIEAFCNKISSKSHSIRNIAMLKEYMHKYGINMSFCIFLLEKIKSRSICDLIQIYLLTSIVKNFYYYHESVNLFLKLDLYDKTKKNENFPISSFDFGDCKTMNDIKKNKIISMIKSILFISDTSIDSLNEEKTFRSFFIKMLSFFTYLKYLKWKIIDSEYHFDIFQSNKYKPDILLSQFINCAKRNSFLFLSSLETSLNILIDPYIKNSISISLLNATHISPNDITFNSIKINSFISSRDISGYILSKCVIVNNAFANLNFSNNNMIQNNNLSLSKNSINVIPLFTNIIKNNNNSMTSMGDNSINAIVNNNNIHHRLNSNNVTVNNNDITVNNLSNNNIAINIANITWKDVLNKTSIDIALPSSIFKLKYGNAKSNKIYKYLSCSYPLSKYDIIVDWKNKLDAIFTNIISNDSQCENEICNLLLFEFINFYFVEDNISKSNEVFMKIKEILKNKFRYNYTQLAVVNIIKAMISEKYIDKEESYSKALTMLLLFFGDMRSGNCHVHPMMMLPLYHLSKTTTVLDNVSNENMKEMFKCVEYNVMNYDKIENKKSEGMYFYNEKTKFLKNVEKKQKKKILDDDINDNIEESECYDVYNNANCIYLSGENISQTVNDCPKWKFFPFPSLSDIKHSYKQIFHTKEYTIFFINNMISLLSYSNSNDFSFSFEFLFQNNLLSQAKESKSSSIFSKFINEILLDKLSYKKHPQDGIVVSFGNNSHNETSHDGYEILSLPRLIYKLSDIKIQKIFCGKEHSIAISSQLNAFSWGNNESGQCGVDYDIGILSTPTKMKIEIAIESASCADKHSYLLTKDTNEIYFCGYHKEIQSSYRIPTKLNFSLSETTEKVLSIKTSQNHSLLLSASGKVYSWGGNENGELGLNTNEVISKPKLITDIIDKVTKISIGDSHSLAVTSNGDVYGWGLSTHSELGLDYNIDTFSTNKNDKNAITKCKVRLPVKITTLNPHHITKTYCGSHFSMFITENNEVFSCGDNSKCQLGLEDKTDILIPLQIDTLFTMKVEKISCGESHCLAMIKDEITKTKTIWGWGSNLYGQLGLGNQIQNTMPRPIAFFMDYNAIVDDVKCGKNFSLVLLRRKDKESVNEKNIMIKYNDIIELFSHY